MSIDNKSSMEHTTETPMVSEVVDFHNQSIRVLTLCVCHCDDKYDHRSVQYPVDPRKQPIVFFTLALTIVNVKVNRKLHAFMHHHSFQMSISIMLWYQRYMYGM